MKYGICCSTAIGFSPTADDVLRFARNAEDLGYHSILVADHVLTPVGLDASAYPAGVFEPRIPWFDPLVLLTAIAGVTKSIRLGTGITVVSYRPPIQQAQAVATLDYLSGGRCFYGAGVGWMREEFDALEIPFAQRGRRADEYIAIMKLLWSGSGEGYDGEFVRFAGGRLNPLPRQRPHPPIFIGGETPAALKRTARLGNGFYINWKSRDEFATILGQLSIYAADVGRSLADFYQQLGATDIAFVRTAKEEIPEYEAMGLDEIIFNPKCASVDEGIDAMKAFADEFF